MNRKRVFVFAIMVVMVFSLAACGSNSKDTAEVASISTADQQEVINQLAEDAAAIPEPDKNAVESAATSSDSSSVTGEDKLLGEWTDINDETRVVKITSNGGEYEYTDPDGTYKGTVSDGVLTIKISDAENDTAAVFIDSKTGNLVTNYQGDIYEFTRKIKQ